MIKFYCLQIILSVSSIFFGGGILFDAQKVKNECIEWIRSFFEENGKDSNAVIGISGGKDSSVAAAL